MVDALYPLSTPEENSRESSPGDAAHTPESEPLPPAPENDDLPDLLPPDDAELPAAENAEEQKSQHGAHKKRKIFLKTAVVVLAICAGGWVYISCPPDVPVEKLRSKYALEGSRFIQLNNKETHVRVTGRGETLLLLHDQYSSLHTWTQWTEILSKKYRVISVDLPGCGLSESLETPVRGAADYMLFLDSLTQRLNIRDCCVAGNGLGARIAWAYGLHASAQVKKIVLLNGSGFEKTSTPTWFASLASLPVVNRSIPFFTPRFFVSSMLEERFYHPESVSDSLIQRHLDLLLYPGHRTALRAHLSQEGTWPPVLTAGNLTPPVLLIWGENDEVAAYKENAFGYHQTIRHSVLRRYRATGHWPQEERPHETAQVVMQFLEGLF